MDPSRTLLRTSVVGLAALAAALAVRRHHDRDDRRGGAGRSPPA